ncbi:triphosphoribosyl-dephospho-CoA synthase CitG [Marinisporobacter balticus]|uniref:Probable 2-(5''-triphosphoribosyl)-3'-dephosphocoenzyme-A synthase n=1 Tax=Marinisporobacter balticus TaxID=2018667 RepID=A0A4R2KZH2_9FIRM|nr:triphosphoribosyl-dephospho-CoA synthase CitG [Marinisporobacter balticus]TCO79333.1 triphosphoribosyl-dephospho-CoA synthase [Marinisporobacter balticus]
MKDQEKFARDIESIAVRALLYEVSTTPKPGLVDRKNNGAHRDMDFFTFIDSSIVLGQIFYDATLTGIAYKGDLKELLHAIRPIGRSGEEKMFAVTNGVNTHKGLIFSLGIIAAAIGSLYQEKKRDRWLAYDICNQVKLMTKDLVDQELKKKDFGKALTYGEQLYVKHGITGIRGEVASGFQTVCTYGLPLLKGLMKSKKGTFNERLIQVLLCLMVHTEDSNILGRHDLDMLQKVQARAKIVFEQGGVFSKNGLENIEEFDKWCINHWVSPGGAADLLAITIMLYLVEQI